MITTCLFKVKIEAMRMCHSTLNEIRKLEKCGIGNDWVARKWTIWLIIICHPDFHRMFLSPSNSHNHSNKMVGASKMVMHSRGQKPFIFGQTIIHNTNKKHGTLFFNMKVSFYCMQFTQNKNFLTLKNTKSYVSVNLHSIYDQNHFNKNFPIKI